MNRVNLAVKIYVSEVEQTSKVLEDTLDVKLVESEQQACVLWMDIIKYLLSCKLLQKYSLISYENENNVELLGNLCQISEFKRVEVKNQPLTIFIQHPRINKEEVLEEWSSSSSSSSDDSIQLEKIDKETILQVTQITEKFNSLVYQNLQSNRDLNSYFVKKQVQHYMFRDQVQLYQI